MSADICDTCRGLKLERVARGEGTAAWFCEPTAKALWGEARPPLGGPEVVEKVPESGTPKPC